MDTASSSLIDVTVAAYGTYVITRMIGEHAMDMAIAATAQLREFIGATGLTKVLIEAPEQRHMFDRQPMISA
jgi:hypothetical protein